MYQVMINCKNFITATFLDIDPDVFSERCQRNRNFLLPPYFFKKQSKILSLEFESQYTILNEEQGGSLASYTETHCGHSCCNKKILLHLTCMNQLMMQMKTIIILHVYILQATHSDSSSNYINCFLEQKLKTPKIHFCIESKAWFKVKFSGELERNEER